MYNIEARDPNEGEGLRSNILSGWSPESCFMLIFELSGFRL